jgi:hypothetical protein
MVLKEAIHKLPSLYRGGAEVRQPKHSTRGGNVADADGDALTDFSRSSSLASNQVVFKSGWLYKRGRLNTYDTPTHPSTRAFKSSVLLSVNVCMLLVGGAGRPPPPRPRALQRRWFVLRRARLEYFKTAEDAEAESAVPTGTILVAEGASVIVAAKQGEFTRQLEISSVEGRVYTLASSSDRDLNEWLIAIRARHADKRLGDFHAVPTSQRPPTQALDLPPQPGKMDFGGSQSRSKTMLRKIMKIAPLESICKVR